MYFRTPDHSEQPSRPLYATYEESAHHLRLSIGMIKKLVRDGKLPVVRFGACPRIPMSALEGFGLTPAIKDQVSPVEVAEVS